MAVSRSVREIVPSSSPGEGAFADSPSVFPYLSDEQLAALAAFCWVHATCEEVNLSTYWLDDLQTVEELEVMCPTCRITRTYSRCGEVI